VDGIDEVDDRASEGQTAGVYGEGFYSAGIGLWGQGLRLVLTSNWQRLGESQKVIVERHGSRLNLPPMCEP
jgi:hypothetical protein